MELSLCRVVAMLGGGERSYLSLVIKLILSPNTQHSNLKSLTLTELDLTKTHCTGCPRKSGYKRM